MFRKGLFYFVLFVATAVILSMYVNHKQGKMYHAQIPYNDNYFPAGFEYTLTINCNPMNLTYEQIKEDYNIDFYSECESILREMENELMISVKKTRFIMIQWMKLHQEMYDVPAEEMPEGVIIQRNDEDLKI